ncbi:hypothetical protein PTKIN_Ptkin16aG0112200 [Pterospermum kingtungense]
MVDDETMVTEAEVVSRLRGPTKSNVYSCKSSLHAVLGRQVNRLVARDDEVWFRIGEPFVKFSKYEFALVTGLRFVTSTFDPNGQHKPPLDRVYATRVTEDDTAKTVHVEGQDNMSYHFYGFAIYLLIWTYEVIPSLGKERALLARPTERPLCLRWQFPKRTKGYFDFFDKLVDVLETLSLSGVDQEHLRLLHIDDDLSKGIQVLDDRAQVLETEHVLNREPLRELEAGHVPEGWIDSNSDSEERIDDD